MLKQHAKDYLVLINSLSELLIRLHSGPRVITELFYTTHHHHPPQNFLHEGVVLGVAKFGM